MTRTIICVIGTRPEAIKMAPVILTLKKTLPTEPLSSQRDNILICLIRHFLFLTYMPMKIYIL